MTDRKGRRDDGDWIFAGPQADPGTYPTERLPGRGDLAAMAASLRPTDTQEHPVVPERDERTREAMRRAVAAGDIGALEAAARRAAADAAAADAAAAEAAALATYARSGSTPNAEDAPRGPVLTLPARFSALSWWDAVRDIVALVTLCSAYTVTYTVADIGAWNWAPRAAIGLGVLALIATHLLRWIPEHPRLGPLRTIRVIGLAPAVLVAGGTILADLVTSLPVLFAPLPQGPPVGIGVGVALLLLGGMLGIEPRAHEGHVPGAGAQGAARRILLGIAVAAAVLLAVCAVMLLGRAVTTGWGFSLAVAADVVCSVLVLTVVLRAALRRDRSRSVLLIGAVAGLVLGAVCDDTLRLAFAAPRSAASGYVYLPLLFAAFAVMVSRAFVRSMNLTFRRADWIVYAVRALELSIVMHLGAVAWGVLTAVSALGPGGSEGWVLPLVDALLAALFAVLSSFGRRALLERPAESARATAVVAAVVMVVVGFLDVIVNSIASGAGAGLVTGGVALAVGIAVALMLTVPAPVRDQYGAPDIVQMFEDFRRRDTSTRSLLARVPDVRQERASKKLFPRG